MVAQTVTTWTKPNLSSYIPSDWFKPSSSIPRVTDSELEQSLEHIREQLNAIRVMRANLSLTKAIIGTDRNVMAVDAQIEQNGIFAAKLNARSDFERMKLEIDKGGYAAMAQLHGQQWQVRLAKKQEQIAKMAQGAGSGAQQPAEDNQREMLENLLGQGDRLDPARAMAAKTRELLAAIDI